MGWCGLNGSGIGQIEGSCKRDNEPPGYIKYWEVLEWLHNWRSLQ
jgi:hypothetical protein